jgi:hypothetical protein
VAVVRLRACDACLAAAIPYLLTLSDRAVKLAWAMDGAFLPVTTPATLTTLVLPAIFCGGYGGLPGSRRFFVANRRVTSLPFTASLTAGSSSAIVWHQFCSACGPVTSRVAVKALSMETVHYPVRAVGDAFWTWLARRCMDGAYVCRLRGQ